MLDRTAPRGRLTIECRPVRAGLNLLSATAECEIRIANTGNGPAEGVRLDARLVSAHSDQDADLAAIYMRPIGRPTVPAFTLAPWESRTVRTVAALAREAIRPMAAGGRQMFVPLLAVNLLYDGGSGPAQTAQAFAIGVERAGSAKLQPFWLDGPPRTHDAVAARPHAAPLER